MHTAFRHVSFNVMNVRERTYGKCSRIVSNARMRQDCATGIVLLSPIYAMGPRLLQNDKNPKVIQYKCPFYLVSLQF